MTSQALLERRRRNNENGINRLIDRMLQEERMRKIITELSREMIAWKKKWLDLALYERTIQTRRHGGGIEGRLSTYY